MNMIPDVFDALLNLLTALSDRVVPLLLPVAAAVLLLFGGAWLAHWIRFSVEETMNVLAVDRMSERIGFHLLVQRLGMGRSPTRVAGFLAQWGLMAVFLAAAADLVGLPAVRGAMASFLDFLPGLLSAVVVMGGGLLLARFLGGLAQGAALANRIHESDFVGRACYWAVAVFSGALALRPLGVDVAMALSSPYFMPLLTAALAGAVALHLLESRRGSGDGLRAPRHPVSRAK